LNASLTRVEIAAVLVTSLALANLIATVVEIAAGPRTYEARIELLAGSGPFADEQQFRDPRLVAGIAELYALLATSRPVLEQTIERLDLGVSVAELAPRVRTKTVIGSPFFAVGVTDADPVFAAAVANEIGAVLASARSGEAASPQALQIVESAIPPTGSTDALRLLAAAVAGVVTLLIGTAVMVLPPNAGAAQGPA